MTYDENVLRDAYTDRMVNNNAIDLSHRVDSVDEALSIANNTLPGEYISITNRNNLGEVFIYQRSTSDDSVQPDGIWDGKSSSIDWYQKNSSVLFIRNAAELRGFADLVNAGYTFSGVEVRLMCNIDLAYHEWEPIGRPYSVKSHKDDTSIYSQYDIEIDKKHTFQGIFNGCGHIIYEFRPVKKFGDTWFNGFFTSILNAEINNISFFGVHAVDKDSNVGFSTLAGVAENSVFTNVNVDGSITCAKPSGICGIARDTSFYNCRNSITLSALSNVPAGLIAGGLCQQVTVSKNMLGNLHKKTPRLFVHCINNGMIYADGRNAKYLWAGHLFGGTYYEEDVDTFSFSIDHCVVHEGITIRVINTNLVKGENVFFGSDVYGDEKALYLTDSTGQSNHTSGTCKDDLMDGIIGRVDKNVTIEVRKPTISTKVDNLVIPGSVNTLVSDAGENAFHTINVEHPNTEEIIYNLEPVYRYVKTSKK